MRNFVAFGSGVAMGLLLGILVGLSISPVIGGVIGALVTIITGYLGSKEDVAQTHNSTGDHERRLLLMGFGLAALIGTLTGISLRANDIFAPTIATDVNRLVEAGYSKSEALRLVAQDRYPTDARTRVNNSVLFSASQEECDTTNPSNLSQSEDILSQFDEVGDDWKNLANAVKRSGNISDAAQRDLLQASWDLACR